jgi:hypothetical protein
MKVGPPLDELSKRRTRTWVERHFIEPQVMSPNTIMPAYKIYAARNGSDHRLPVLDRLAAIVGQDGILAGRLVNRPAWDGGKAASGRLPIGPQDSILPHRPCNWFAVGT